MVKQLTSMQLRILRRLLELNREIPRGELAEYLKVTSANLHIHLILLEDGDFIKIVQSPGRGNSHRLSITDKGKNLLSLL